MTPTLALLALLTLAGGASGAYLWRRARRARRELARALHDRSLELDRRADHLQRQLDQLDLEGRAGHLIELVDACCERGIFGSATAARVRGFAWELGREARARRRANRR